MIHDTPLWAFGLGFASAISLLIGAGVGLAARPRALLTSALMAFGAGALLFALTIEIVAHSFHVAGFAPLALGCVIGGVMFEILNQALNRHGGFMRKASTLIRHLTRVRRRRAESIVDHLARIEILRALPAPEIALLVPHVEEVLLPDGDEVVREGAPGDALYLVDAGEVRVSREGAPVATLRAGDAFGEMALLSGEPRNATVTVAAPGTRLFRLDRSDFDRLMAGSPAVAAAVGALARARGTAAEAPSPDRETWRAAAAGHLHEADFRPTRADTLSASSHVAGAAVLGIWLGILLDAIPESIVIGTSIIGAHASPWGLLAGVFLANLPEAMSSSVVMRLQRYSVPKILGLWSVVVVVTALGALVGNVALRGLDPRMFAVIEGCAAGAMLTSIAETMLPEAYEQGGWIVGLATLAGFLAALFVKAIT